MAGLPHFNILPHLTSNVSANHKPQLDLLYQNLTTIDFGIEVLNEFCFRIKKKTMTFQLNIDLSSGTIPVLNTLQDSISKKSILSLVELKHFDKNGQVIGFTIIENLSFVKFKNLLDYDWAETSTKELEVKFDYEKATYVPFKEHTAYIRKLKLKKVEKSC